MEFISQLACQLRDYTKAENPPNDCHLIALALEMMYLNGRLESAIEAMVPKVVGDGSEVSP